MEHPVQERLALFVVAEGEQRAQGERGVAQPAVTIVPVADSAQLLRERGRGRRDDRAGWGVGHQLERERAADDGVAVRSLVGAARRPGLPPGDGPLDAVAGRPPPSGGKTAGASWLYVSETYLRSPARIRAPP